MKVGTSAAPTQSPRAYLTRIEGRLQKVLKPMGSWTSTRASPLSSGQRLRWPSRLPLEGRQRPTLSRSRQAVASAGHEPSYLNTQSQRGIFSVQNMPRGKFSETPNHTSTFPQNGTGPGNRGGKSSARIAELVAFRSAATRVARFMHVMPVWERGRPSLPIGYIQYVYIYSV